MATTKVIPGVLDLNATGAVKGLKMPSGTTANQPTGALGIIRNNTSESNGGSSSCMEYYNGSNWKVMVNCTTNVLDIFDDGSCMAAYTFDGNVNDLGGNYNGTATSITYTAGKYGQSASFNGTSSKIELPSALSDGSTTDANCISFWFNVGAEITPATPNKEFMSFAFSGGAIGKITAGSTTGNFTGETFSVSSDVVTQYTYSKTNIPAGWNHAVVQWNSGNTKWDIYINGVAHTTYTFGTNEQGKFALKFGNRSSFYYPGELDQIRVFTKILSASEVTTLYNEVAC
jgi:hypothetical protein